MTNYYTYNDSLVMLALLLSIHTASTLRLLQDYEPQRPLPFLSDHGSGMRSRAALSRCAPARDVLAPSTTTAACQCVASPVPGALIHVCSCQCIGCMGCMGCMRRMPPVLLCLVSLRHVLGDCGNNQGLSACSRLRTTSTETAPELLGQSQEASLA